MYKGKEYVTKAITSGADGYLLKDAGATEFVAAIRAGFRGENYLSPAISAHLVAKYTWLAHAEKEAVEPLTPRQREVLRLIAEGLSTKAIAKMADD
jgi:DNA-binding NarL/FixJ family response regulator